MNTLKRWQLLTNIQIEKIWPGWVGISTFEDGKRILVKGPVLPHSTVSGRITRNKKDYIELGHTDTISIQEGRGDITPRCSHYHDPLTQVEFDQEHRYSPVGCKRQIVPYDKQLELKMEMVRDSFRGHDQLLKNAELLPIIGSPLIDNYRNKVEFSFGKYITKASNDEKNNSLSDSDSSSEEMTKDTKDNSKVFSRFHERQLGYHKQWHYDKIIDVDYCVLVSDKANEIFQHIKVLAKDSWLPVYDQMKHDGVLRSLFVREGFHTQEMMVNLVIAKNNIPLEWKNKEREKFLENIQKDTFLQEQITTFIVTDNSTLSDAMRRSEATLETLWWPWTIRERLSLSINDKRNWANKEMMTSLEFVISPSSCFQTNTVWAEVLFSLAIQYAKLPDGKSTLLDLYCGTWSIGLSFLKSWIGKKLLGIEIVEGAIEDAKLNAKLNWLSEQSYFVAGKVESLMNTDRKIKESLDDLWLVILDPPRSWLHPSVPIFLNDLKKEYTFQLIYISCNPVTLARDLELLVEGWRKLTTLQPVDMFPHTHHSEMISILS